MSRSKAWCKHYNGTQNRRCEAGVAYGLFVAPGGRLHDKLPCFEGRPDTCPERELPTKEEIAAENAAIEAYLENVSTARRAVAAHIKEAGKWKTNCSGVIRCPICDNGKLEWGYAGRYNGHIGGECSTNGCVNWQE